MSLFTSIYGAFAVSLMVSGAIYGGGQLCNSNVSQAQWLWTEPAAESPANAYLRLSFDIDSPVKAAWFCRFGDKRCTDWINGQRVSLRPMPGFRERYHGHVKGDGIDLKPLLRNGRNVLAFHLGRNAHGCYGLILRGEVEFENGRTLRLFSNPVQVKGSAAEEPDWASPDFDDSAWKPAVSQGDVRLRPWSRYGNIAEIYMAPDEFARYRDRITAGFPEKAILAEPPETQVRIVYSGEVPGISINGGKALPPDRLTHVDEAETPAQDSLLAHARTAGMWAFEVSATHTFQCGDGHFDFSVIDRAVRHALSVWPEAYVYFGFMTRNAMNGWLKRHPEECVGYAVKRQDHADWGDYSGNPTVPSFASAAYRAEVRRFVLALGEYCRSQPWGRRVIGMHDGYGGSGDGMPWGCHSMPDTGLRMTEALRRYLVEKYGSDDALQKAWGDSSVTLASATVPDAVARFGSGAYVRDLSDPRDRRRADFLDAYHKEFNDFEIAFCKAVKEAFPGRLAGAYYGYMVLSYEPEGSTARCEELLKSPYVDYLKATTRGYNLTDGLHRHLHSLFHRYGKLSSIEGDVRTHLGLKSGQGEARWCCRSPAETRSTVAKFAMNARMFGAGWHVVDFGRNSTKWFNCPEAMDVLAASRKVWEKDFASPPIRTADVAVLFDVDQVWREGPPDYQRALAYQNNLVTYPLQALNFSGFAHDMLAPEDYAKSSRRYRAVVFLNTCYDTATLRAVARKARTDGAVSIWCATPGLSTPTGWSEASMRELTGMRLRASRQPRAFRAKGMEGHDGYEPFAVRPDWTETPRVFVDDPDAEIKAKWIDDGTTAFAEKRLADGTRSVFLGMPFNVSSQWADLLKSAGGHAFSSPGFMVRRNSRYLMVFSGKDGTIPPESRLMERQMSQAGRVTVQLEQPYASVRDVLTGEIVAQDKAAFTLSSETPRVWMLETE